MSVEAIFASPELKEAFVSGLSLGVLLMYISLGGYLLFMFIYERFIKTR